MFLEVEEETRESIENSDLTTIFRKVGGEAESSPETGQMPSVTAESQYTKGAEIINSISLRSMEVTAK